MYNSYLEEIMEKSVAEREELKKLLLIHGEDLRLLAHIEAEEAKCNCNKGSYYLP